MFVDQIVEIVGCFRESLGNLGLANLFHDLRPDCVQRRGLRSLDLIETDDVKAVLRLDRPGNVADLHREGGLIEGLDHQAACEKAKIAALLRGSGILGKFRREFAKFLRVRFCLPEQILGLRPGLGLFIRTGRCGSRYQNVAGASFFGGLITALVLEVELLDLLVADLHATLIGFQRKHHELDLDPLGNHELAFVLGVVFLRIGIGNVDLLAIVRRAEQDLADLPFLLANFQQSIRDRVRNKSRAGINAAHLLQHDVRAYLVFERGRGQSLSLQQLAIALARELARLVVECLDGGNHLLEFGIRYRHPGLGRVRQRDPALDKFIEHRLLELRAVEQRRVRIVFHHLAHLFLGLAQRLGIFDLGNARVADLGQRTAGIGIAEIEIDAEESERRDDEYQQRYLQPAFVLVDEIVHGPIRKS